VYEYNANIIRVYDGDTVWADLDLGFGLWMRNQPIRLRGINTPEVRGESKEAGINARDRLRDLLTQADNKCVIKTVKGDEIGMYGRILGELLVEGEKISLNQILLDEGFAVPYMK
jgi:micrococcal nuclease